MIPTAHSVETASGRYIDLADPSPDDILLEDIAHGLAHTCRFGGHSSTFYSVAEHAVLVAAYLDWHNQPPAVALAGLHHDDAEAYLGDIPSPLKPLLGPAYRQLTNEIDRVISLALDLPRANADVQVRAADDWALAAEAYYLLPSRGEGWYTEGLFDPDDYYGMPFLGDRNHPLGLPPDEAAQLWLDEHRLLVAA